MTVLEQIGGWVARPDPLSESGRQHLAAHLLDTLGAWIAARATEEAAMLARLQAPDPVSPLSFVPLDRILLAVAATRLTEIDDIHMSSCVTPSAVVVPAAVILASRLPAQDFAAALNAGYEVMTRLGVAVNGPEILYRGIWPTYLAAPVGAAAVAARLLGFDPGQTADALALALAQAPTSPGTPGGASPRWLLLGNAALAGCASALAVASGSGGDRTLLDGDWTARAHGIALDPAPLVAPPSQPGAIAEVSLKPYCAAKQAIAAIEAFRQLLAQGISPDQIASVEVAVPPAYAAMIGRREPASGRTARITCAAYHLALAAYQPAALEDVRRPNLAADPRIAAFLERVTVVPDPALALHYPRRWPARVRVTLAEGRRLEQSVLDTRGDPGTKFSAREKFGRTADLVIGQTAAERIGNACERAVECDEGLPELLSALKSAQLLD